MSSIQVPDTITKLAPNDLYPVVNGEDVSGFVDLRNKVDANTAKIETNIDNIKNVERKGDTYAISNKGDTPPVFPSEQKGNYLVVQRVQTSSIVITTPAPLGGMVDGAIFNIYNESPKYSVRLTPASGDTINSGNFINIPPENFASFVYQLKDRNYLELESGYIPSSRFNITNYITQTLDADGKIHTEQELEDAGFLKGLQVVGGGVSVTGANQLSFSGASVASGPNNSALITIAPSGDSLAPTQYAVHFQSIAQRDRWSSQDGSKYSEVICIVDRDDNGYVAWYKWNGKVWEAYNAQGIILSDTSGAIPKVIKTAVFGDGFSVQQAGDQEDAALITYAGGTGDGTIGVNQIGGQSNKVSNIDIYDPLETYADPDKDSTARLLIRHDAFESQHGKSCLVKLKADMVVKGSTATPIYCDSEVIPFGEYFSPNVSKFGINVQDNTGDDPNITGGQLTEILASVGFIGKAPEDGNIKVWLEYKDPASLLPPSVLIDVNNTPVLYERAYHKDEDLESLILVGAMMATGQAPVALKVETSFSKPLGVTIDPDTTMICINQFSSGYETSIARTEFQNRLGVHITPVIYEFKEPIGDLDKSITGVSLSEQVIAANDGYSTVNGFNLVNHSDVKLSISDGDVNIKDNGSIADFYMEFPLDSDRTKMLHGKDIRSSVTLKNPDGAFNLAMFAWSGKANQQVPIYSTRNNGALELNTGWSLVGKEFLIERPANDSHTKELVLKVPVNATNVSIVVYPEEAQSPLTLVLETLVIKSGIDFIGYVEKDNINTKEYHLNFSDSYAEFGLNAQSFVSLRYTIGTAVDGNPMPVGPLLKGKAPVSLDNSKNQVVGSGDPSNDGVILFNKDGQASVAKVYRVCNETDTDNQVIFWDLLFNSDGSSSKIAGSEHTFTIPAKTASPGLLCTIPAYIIQVEKGQSIGGRAQADIDDGAYIYSDSESRYLVQTTIELGEEDEIPTDDPWAGLDLTQFELVYKHQITGRVDAKKTDHVDIPLKIPEHMYIDVKRGIQRKNGVIRPIKNMDYSYHNGILKVTFGEVVEEGKVLIGVYS